MERGWGWWRCVLHTSMPSPRGREPGLSLARPPGKQHPRHSTRLSSGSERMWAWVWDCNHSRMGNRVGREADNR